ncbi:MAG: hypothetical protein ACKO2L_07640 [Planctomycetaceae bacterium]
MWHCILLSLLLQSDARECLEFDWHQHRISWELIPWPLSRQLWEAHQRAKTWVPGTREFAADQQLIERSVRELKYNSGLVRLLEYSIGMQAYYEYNAGDIAAACESIRLYRKLCRPFNRIRVLENRIAADADKLAAEAEQLAAEGRIEAAHIKARDAVLSSGSAHVRSRAVQALETDLAIRAVSFSGMAPVERYFGNTLLAEPPLESSALCQPRLVQGNMPGLMLTFDSSTLEAANTSTRTVAERLQQQLSRSFPGLVSIEAVDAKRLRFNSDIRLREVFLNHLRSVPVPEFSRFKKVAADDEIVYYRQAWASTNVRQISLQQSMERLPLNELKEMSAEYELIFTSLSETERAEAVKGGCSLEYLGKLYPLIVFSPCTSLTDDERRLFQTAAGDEFFVATEQSPIRELAQQELRASWKPTATLRIRGNPNSVAYARCEQILRQAGVAYEFVAPMDCGVHPRPADFDVFVDDVFESQLLLTMWNLSGAADVADGVRSPVQNSLAGEWLREVLSQLGYSTETAKTALTMMQAFGMATSLGANAVYVLKSPKVVGSVRAGSFLVKSRWRSSKP